MNINKKNLPIFFLVLPLLLVKMSYANNTYTIGVNNFEDSPPYSTVKKNEYRGFNRELLDMFAQSQGFIFNYKIRPIKRLYSEFLNGELDFKYPDNKKWWATLKQNKTIYYTNPIVNYTTGLIVREENKGRALSQLKEISVLNGFTLEKKYLLAQQQGSLTVIRTHHYQRLLDLVVEKRVDGAYFDISIQKYHVINSQGESQSLVFDDTLPYIEGTMHLSSIKHPKIILLFNQFLNDYKTKIQALKSRYHLNESINIH